MVPLADCVRRVPSGRQLLRDGDKLERDSFQLCGRAVVVPEAVVVRVSARVDLGARGRAVLVPVLKHAFVAYGPERQQATGRAAWGGTETHT